MAGVGRVDGCLITGFSATFLWVVMAVTPFSEGGTTKLNAVDGAGNLLFFGALLGIGTTAPVGKAISGLEGGGVVAMLVTEGRDSGEVVGNIS